MPSKYDDLQVHDLMAEERSRGTRHPKYAVSLKQKRELLEIGRMILNRNCTKREYLQAIRRYGPQDGSLEFQRFVKLWDEKHGQI
jgi:hypothetical protein